MQALPHGIRSRFIDNVNGLRMHVLEAGFESPGRPLVVLLHGFPELAFSWRRVMPLIAQAGFYVVAPDQRGYGRTTGWSGDYDGDLSPFRFLNLVRDTLGMVASLGVDAVAGIVGHDFGSWVAAWCALIRGDVFRSATLMSAPFAGAPPLDEDATSPPPHSLIEIEPALGVLGRPRKHYHVYYTTRQANAHMWHAPQGVHDFLRAYFHYKSADWPHNKPVELNGWTADELARMPSYYIMDRDCTMADTVVPHMPSSSAIAQCAWLPDDALAVYASEFSRTGFQGGLNWYRCRLEPRFNHELQLFAGRGIDVPSQFIAGASDWGPFQSPGALKAMDGKGCRDLRGCHLLAGAGHWVQQEQPEQVAQLIVALLEAG